MRPVDDGDGGGFDEYVMLRLRLSEGLTEAGVYERFGYPIPEAMRKKAEKFRSAGLAEFDEKGIRLTRRGFLLSNSIISIIVELLE